LDLINTGSGNILLPKESTRGVRRLFGLGTQELVVILAIVFLIFGAKRLPEIGSGLGRAIKNFKGGIKSVDEGTPEKNLDKPEGNSKSPGGNKSA
jgi:sec-independent protein translocase protein TatA